MMDEAKVKDLARLYAGMTPEQIEAHEDWVRRYKAEQAAEAEQYRAAAAKRTADLRAADDVGAVQMILHRCVDSDGLTDPYQAMKMLADAGYRRVTEMTMAMAIDALEHAAGLSDVTQAHKMADKLVCIQLRGVGMQAVVDAFERVGKRYA